MYAMETRQEKIMLIGSVKLSCDHYLNVFRNKSYRKLGAIKRMKCILSKLDLHIVQ